MECYTCHNLGHYQYECPTWEKRVNYAEFNEDEEMLLMAQEDSHQNKKEGVWFLDSGCSNHMSGNKEWFVQLDESFRHLVKLGNNSKLEVIGKGNIILEFGGSTQTVSDVFFIPELCNNLLSIGKLQDRDITIIIKHGVCKLYHPNRGCIMESMMTTNRMFLVTTSILISTSTCFKVNVDNLGEIWHKRFGHLSYKNLALLHNKKLVRGFPKLNASSKICTSCMVRKQHREAIPKKSIWRAKQQLQLIHSDIYGPTSPESHGNKRYILTFIDDFSRKIWVYFLNEKSETFTIFKEFKTMTEKETSLALCCLRTDRGGESNSNEFSNFYKAQGIKRQLTTTYTPQQNGVIERKNRTIMNMVRCILEEKRLPKMFWLEAAKWPCHVLNRSLASTIKDKTPEECWSGFKPSVEHFKVFGCVGNVHVPEARRFKLDTRSQKQVFIGYNEKSKGYKMINPLTMKVTISRDVIFEEDGCWNWGRTDAKSESDVLDWGEAYEEALEKLDEHEDENTTSESKEEHLETEDSSSNEATTPQTLAKRTRKTPIYLQDYISGGELSEDEAQIFLMFMSTDPIYYEEAVKEKNWRDAMDMEIAAIKKNQT